MPSLSSWLHRLLLDPRATRSFSAKPACRVRARVQLEALDQRIMLSTYYVSPTGSDRNDGLTPASAWKTITRVNEATFLPGDSILLKGGARFQGNLEFNSASAGTPEAPITVSAYGTGRATIDAGIGFGLKAYDTAGFDISNLDFIGAGAAVNRQNGIMFHDDLPGDAKLQHVYIDHVNVSGFGLDGVDIAALTATNGYDDVRITNVGSDYNGQVAIYVWGQTPAVSNTNVYIGYCAAYGNGLHGLEIGDTNVGTIEYSLAHDNGTGGGGEVGIWTYDSNDILIQYNESYHNRNLHRDDGDGFDFDGGVTNSIMQYNYSHDNDGAGFLIGEYPTSGPTSGNIIRFNISQNDGQRDGYAGIYLYDLVQPTNKVTDNFIYNNTIYNSSGGADVVVAGNLAGSTNIFANNIFVAADGVPLIRYAGPSGATFIGNDYWTGSSPYLIDYHGGHDRSLRAFQAAGQEMLNGQPVGLSINPRLEQPGGGETIGNRHLLHTLTAYRLESTSGLIGAGLNLRSLYGMDLGPNDFFGDPLPLNGPFDLGADDETVPAGTVLAPVRQAR
jgi:hypothetical protein